ncbi:hypothetical protein [Thalassotalea ganghwensis]
MKLHLLKLLIIVFVCFSNLALSEVSSNYLFLTKQAYVPGETIVLRLNNLPKLGEKPWVGVVNSEVVHGSEELNDREKISSIYVADAKHSLLYFDAPLVEGKYDLRLNDSDYKGIEIDHVSFEVSKGLWKDQIQLSLDKSDYYPEEPIHLNYVVPHSLPDTAWVALVPSSAPNGFSSVNNQQKLEYKRVSGGDKGTLVFTAPNKLGTYELRIHDGEAHDSIELKSLVFDVSLSQWNDGTSLSLVKTNYKAGESIFLTYTVPQEISGGAYASIVPSNIPHGNESINDKHDLQYHNIKGIHKGILEFVAPNKNGPFDIRFHNSDNGYEIAHISFEVND